jgi:hypothetical protein
VCTRYLCDAKNVKQNKKSKMQAEKVNKAIKKLGCPPKILQGLYLINHQLIE